MKVDKYIAFLMGVFLGAIITLSVVLIATFFEYPETPSTTYECPCEVEQVVTDVIRHTNKDGMQTITTYIDVKDCILSNNN